jgi:serine/threonine-protein kinase
MTSPAVSPVQVGDVVGGKYEVIRTLGRGGMGFVVAARHTTLDQTVAIKFLVRDFGEHDEAAARFLREARAAAKIESDYVCRVFDTGTLDSGIPYLVMEVLEGIDLEQELDQRGRLPIDEAVDLMLQALDAISTAHKLGVVHRDLKPANLFLTVRPDGSRRLKVFDFGISKSDEGDIAVTDTDGIIGTPAYMSPEQARNAKKADHRTDIFSLGAILFESLSGRPPHVGESIGEILDSVMNKKPADVAELCPDLPEPLAAAIMRAIDPDREARFQSASEMARAIASYGTGAYASLAQSVPAPAPSQRLVAPDSARTHASTRETVAGWTQGGLRELVQRRRGYVAFGVAALVISAAAWIAMVRAQANSAATDTLVPAATERPVGATAGSVETTSAPATADSAMAAAAAAPSPSTSASAAAAPSASAQTPSKTPKSDASAGPGLQRGKNKGNPLLDTRE